MPNLSLTRVNQKLAQSKVLLSGVDEESLTPIHRNSLMEAAAFHLVSAYHHYLRELTETYGLKHATGVRTEGELTQAFEAANKHPVEADELLALRETKNSWLAQLHNYYDSLWLLPKQTDPRANDQPDDNLIFSVNLDVVADQLSVDLKVISQWHAEFVALVLRQRETSAEF